jgi:protein-S-isoprenylcysteine O-methyltransferase Ste14
VLVNPALANWLLWLCECGLQVARALAEENLLLSDPEYRAYRARVRYRLVPGLV